MAEKPGFKKLQVGPDEQIDYNPLPSGPVYGMQVDQAANQVLNQPAYNTFSRGMNEISPEQLMPYLMQMYLQRQKMMGKTPIMPYGDFSQQVRGQLQ
jgi:hypothetical protein